MGTTKRELITYALKPLAWVYGTVTSLRNKLFDLKILKQETFGVPVVTIGNISVGGTGKTPHVEYVVRNLASDFKIAVLSRGYKRKTKGFVLANRRSTPDTIGDEAYQIYQKHGMRVKVAVCEKRSAGIKELLRLFPKLDLIVLDDGLQHRYVKPTVSIMLTTRHKPYYTDKLLPLGTLRENSHSAYRADIVVMTDCEPNMSPLDMRIVKRDMSLFAFQKLYFSKIEYKSLQPVFPDDDPFAVNLTTFGPKDSVLILTGIAKPRTFIRHFNSFGFKVRVAHYPDHHNFTGKDINRISKIFKGMKGERKIILTTEKDAVRLLNNPYYPEELKPYTFYVPINVSMLDNKDIDFIQDLRKLIREGMKEE